MRQLKNIQKLVIISGLGLSLVSSAFGSSAVDSNTVNQVRRAIVSVPEPIGMQLIGAGLVLIGLLRFKRRKQEDKESAA